MAVRSRLPILLLLGFALAGCSQRTGLRSSVVEYLYPGKEKVVAEPGRPVLELPLSVGIAFVPEQPAGSRGFGWWTGAVGGEPLPEARKMELLEQVAKEFRDLDFVRDIEVIPGAYLRPGGSFDNLDQLQRMYGIDVVALVSYDQVQFTDEGLLSLSYWTLVGAYAVAGEKNDTNTLMDTAVYDIASRRLLFRAPGVSRVKGSATPVNLAEQLRADSLEGFRLATEDMIANLKTELQAFKTRLEEQPELAEVRHAEGYDGGAGAIGWALPGLALLVLRRRARHRPVSRSGSA